MSQTPTLVEVKGLTMRFGGLTALDHLDMSIHEGEVLGLLGPNGSGKTTFFNVLTGLYKASSGSISYRGGEIIGKTPQEIYRSGVARTFQRSRLSLPLTVFDNIVIGDYQHMQHGLVFNLLRRRAFRAEYEAYVEKVRGLLDIFSPPLVDRMFEPVETFTMIDRRRIEVCRALLSQPRLLLLDEPSLGLAPLVIKGIFEAIHELRRSGLTILLVEQMAKQALGVADRAYVLETGRITLEGSGRELLDNPRVKAAYLGSH